MRHFYKYYSTIPNIFITDNLNSRKQIGGLKLVKNNSKQSRYRLLVVR